MRSPESPRRSGPRVATVLALLVGLAACGGGTAERPEGGTLRWGDDLLSGGPTVTAVDSVPGDAILAGEEVRFSGWAGGSVLAAGRRVEVGGRVGGSVRSAGGTVRLLGEVERNVTAAGANVSVEEDAVVRGNAYLAGGLIEVLGIVEGSLRVGGGEVLIDGPVLGDVHVEAGRLRLGPDARIEGDLTYRVEEDGASLASDARVAGSVEALPAAPAEDRSILFRVLRILAFVVTGSVLVALLPHAAASAARTARRRWAASLGTGFLWLVLVPLGVLLTAVSMVGLPLAVMAAFLYGASLYLGPLPVAVWLGDRLLPGRPEGSRAGAVTCFATGGAVLAVLFFVPALGVLLRLLVTLTGLGAVGLLVNDRLRGASEAA